MRQDSALAQVLHQCNELPGVGMGRFRRLIENRPELVKQAEAEYVALSQEQRNELDKKQVERRNRMINRLSTQRGNASVGGVLAVLVVLALLFLGGWALWAYSVGARTVTGVVERTMNADNVIYNYEWFKQEYQQIQAFDSQVVTAKQQVAEAEATPLKDRDFRDKEELTRLRTVLQGLRNQRDSRVGEYNARARMANRNIFMGSDVPAQLKVVDDKTVVTTQN